MPGLRRRNKLVIPQNLSDPAPDREVASSEQSLEATQVISVSPNFGMR